MPFVYSRASARISSYLLLCLFFFAGIAASAQSGGNSAVISGTVVDASGAVVPNAAVEIHNPVSGFDHKATTDNAGTFSFTNVPFNSYHLAVNAAGFAETFQDVDVRSAVPITLKVSLGIAGSNTAVTVEASGADLLENDSIGHTDISRQLFDKMPLESASSQLSSLVTLSSPGVSADSNGLFHGMGDHAENSFSVDGQAITDQQSKIFSNQLPTDAIDSLEVIPGAPPAEFGGKTSLVIVATTRSGIGVTTPHGSATASYGSFGTSTGDVNLAYGNAKIGNFISIGGLNSGRFLDPPEFQVFHARGNEQNIFDRVDGQPSSADSLHLNLGFTRSWFQTPNSFDNLNVVDQFGNPVGDTDQRSQIVTYNIAPSWTHTLGTTSVFNLGVYLRRDGYHYYPSNDPLADLGPIQQETVSQYRTLTNAGAHADFSYVKGIHNIKIGGTYQHTFLKENDNLGIVDPAVNAPCTDATGAAVSGFTDPAQCGGGGFVSNPAFLPELLQFDLTRGGGMFPFRGRADVKELGTYIQDTISKGHWSFNLGLRGDLYNGLVADSQFEPRLGVSYNVPKTSTVLRASYGRSLETPFNENLVLASEGCNSLIISDLIPCVQSPNTPGYRNEFHAGLQQAFGRYVVVSGDYVWKYTHTAYDFSILAATPIFFPIGWHNSKITGPAIRVSVPDFHGFTALVVMSSVAARFFPPQDSGLGVTVGQSGLPFRIDHDEQFNQTTHLQYQPWKNGPWMGFNWRYDSGLVAGAVPFATDTTTPVDLTGLTADQQIQAGLFCGGQLPTLGAPLTSCAPNSYGSNLINIPAPGTENDDKNPPRIAPRNLFDVSLGDDNLFHGDRFKWSGRVTAINVTNKVALYNFLSTFSGTHYVTPRAITAEIGFHF
jgi:hypothetical protein